MSEGKRMKDYKSLVSETWDVLARVEGDGYSWALLAPETQAKYGQRLHDLVAALRAASLVPSGDRRLDEQVHEVYFVAVNTLSML